MQNPLLAVVEQPVPVVAEVVVTAVVLVLLVAV
jgi:hypothetical protein